ncbi:MAG TPA: FAD-dependent oxidoreductase [Spirochaetota bacterium]|nr:FAD-dependent oxidoreductase [Spirochaetota bacterium]HPV42080.1 FAD-dependent oxidoreductase [Spirochaetota bacterium]
MKTHYQERVKNLIDNLSGWYNDQEMLLAGQMTDRLYPYTNLFSPIQINHLKIKNRIVMGPMGNVNMADETGRPNNKMIQYFVERARGGVGLITTGLVPVDFTTDPSIEDADNLGIFPRIDSHRTNYAGWKDLAERCHAHGARVFIQLTPGLGRVGSPECLIKRHRIPVSASWNRSFYMPMVMCRPLTGRECGRLIRNAGQNAADAKEMGIDGVYFHGHEGYLLEQMTNPAFNRRSLGRYRDWQAFGVDLIREVRRRTGDRYPIMYRIDLTLALRETYGDRMNSEKLLKKFRNERTVDMTLDYMKNLVKAGVDIFDVDLGCYDNWWLPHPPNAMAPGVYLEVSSIVKEYFDANAVVSNHGIPVPIVAVGKLGYPDLAERALRENKCDMVMLARPLLADPHWPRKAYAGKLNDIIPCIGDQEGCLNQVPTGGHIKCAVNPVTGFEDVTTGYELFHARTRKKIAIIGAGPAGVYCACIASSRGHSVTIFDRRKTAGGSLIPGSIPNMKYEVQNYVEFLNNSVRRFEKRYDLTVRFGSEVDVNDLAGAGYDALVVCTGSSPKLPPVEGINLPHVITAIDLLNYTNAARDRNRFVIVGGSEVGCEVAHMLAYEMNKKDITVIEMLPAFMKKSCTANRGFLIHYLERAGVKLLNCTRLLKITSGGVQIAQNISATVPNPYVTWKPIIPDNIIVPLVPGIKVREKVRDLEADLVILATGAKPDDTLYYRCLEARVAPEVYNIGDSVEPGRVFEATRAGYELGRSL